ncbi:MAG: class I SAM-dependent methyltransferase [Ignavibacteriae bacterium]|nr:class I SAM-dependent methyltransferase [Ignavibacteriota bacterium]
MLDNLLKATATMTHQKIDANNSVCGICGGRNLDHLFWSTDFSRKTTQEQWSVSQCKDCTIVQTTPRPSIEELSRYYPDFYYPIGDVSTKYFKRYIMRYQKDKVEKISRFRRNGKVLDIGCGVGFFLKEASDTGYESEGIELSSLAANIGKERWKLEIVNSDFLSYPYSPSTFDIVTLWHVLEHFDQPVKVLQKVNQILKPGGLLVIAVPNIQSIQAKIFRSHWYGVDVPRHLYHFTPASLTSIVEPCGFKVDFVDHFCREHNGGVILGSIISLSPPNESFSHKLLRKTIGKYVTETLGWLESCLGKGGTFTLFAIKK